eukprot:2647525-Amphidinium_carterae.1
MSVSSTSVFCTSSAGAAASAEASDICMGTDSGSSPSLKCRREAQSRLPCGPRVRSFTDAYTSKPVNWA